MHVLGAVILFFPIGWLFKPIQEKGKENKHNAELQRADPGTKVMG